MSKTDVMLVVGARPQFIKSAPLIREILSGYKEINLSIIHSGQHYDQQMSEIFFRQLKIPAPLANLKVGSGSHAAQTAKIMKRLEDLVLRTMPDVVIVPGDTNTTLAASLAATKLAVPVAHIEAGLRSGDITMPEEINRKITDHCSTLLFAPTRKAVHNLQREGLGKATRLTGDTMVDALHAAASFVEREQGKVLERFGLQPQDYVLVTLHRPSNVDNLNRLLKIHLALRKVAKKLRVVFPVHPRTRLRLTKLGAYTTSRNDGVALTNPQGYIEILALLKNAKCLLTDSGGMQKESFLLHVPCVTLRNTTEWPETLAGKANQLLFQPDMIPKVILKTAFDEALKEGIMSLKNPFGDGHASSKIARILKEAF